MILSLFIFFSKQILYYYVDHPLLFFFTGVFFLLWSLPDLGPCPYFLKSLLHFVLPPPAIVRIPFGNASFFSSKSRDFLNVDPLFPLAFQQSSIQVAPLPLALFSLLSLSYVFSCPLYFIFVIRLIPVPLLPLTGISACFFFFSPSYDPADPSFSFSPSCDYFLSYHAPFLDYRYTQVSFYILLSSISAVKQLFSYVFL